MSRLPSIVSSRPAFAGLLALGALAACDAGVTPEDLAPASEHGALTGTVDLTFSIRASDGRGDGSARIVDEASGRTLATCDDVCVVPVARDSRVRFIATPASGSTFAGWHGVCYGAAADACVMTVGWHLAAGADFRAAAPPPSST